MSADGISALERGHRRTPFRETLALLAGALALDDEQRREFERAAARQALPRRRGSVTVGPWADEGYAALPLALTSFVGREKELAEIAALVRAHRLVTVTGAGGIGKTQTTLRVAEELDGALDGTVYFVGLAPIRDSLLIVAAIASALSIQAVPGKPLLATVIAYLKNRKMLLIFDNCEHVIAEAANVIGALLSACREIRVLATSREPLKTAGEHAYHLRSLESAFAVVLFGDRARAADQRFSLSEDNAAVVAEICRRLDNIPVAIELAAARVRVLSLRTLAEQLDDRFRILTSGERAALPRHKTMWATIEWSYDLLAAPEQLLLARLGIFTGSFSLDAVSAICGGHGLDDDDIFDLLASLTDKSLVVADTSGEQDRYRLLESTAAYAREKLGALAERADLMRDHAEYFCRQALDFDEYYGTVSTAPQVARAKAELDNYRLALEWSLTRNNDAVLGGAIAGSLGLFWVDADLEVEGRYWIGLALPRVSEAEHPATAARLQLAQSIFLDGKPRYNAVLRAIELYESVGDRLGAGRAYYRLGFALYQMGRLDEAGRTNARALESLRVCGNSFDVAQCLNGIAVIELNRGNFSMARELHRQALDRYRAVGHTQGVAQMLANAAEAEFAAGSPEQALRLTNEALELANRLLRTQCRVNSAAYQIALCDLSGARESACVGLELARQGQFERRIADALRQLALLAALSGDARRGAQLQGYVKARYDALGLNLAFVARWTCGKLLVALRENLSDEEVETLAFEGAAWSEDRAVDEASKVV